MTHGLSLTVFELFSWLQKRFSPLARPPVQPGYDDKYRSRSYRFVDRQTKENRIVDELSEQEPNHKEYTKDNSTCAQRSPYQNFILAGVRKSLMGFRLAQLSARQLPYNSLPRVAHTRCYKYTESISGFVICLSAEKFGRRIGGLGPTICGVFLFKLFIKM